MEDHQPTFPEDASGRSAAALRELEQRAHRALAAGRDHATRLEEEITTRLQQLAAALQEQDAAGSSEAAELDRTRSEIARLDTELEESRAAWNAERATLEAARDELADRVAMLAAERDELLQRVDTFQAEQGTTKEEWRTQLAEFEEKLTQQQSAWSEQRSAWSRQQEKLESERDELHQKFELALEDVQRFRSRVAELEQELSRRPEANETDSAELVALRAERDALAEQVEQLEGQAAAPIDASSEQQMADLQRRFELAVEDLRELKTTNAQLESRLASAVPRPAATADSGSMDWESQKRRLLASLQDDGDVQDEPQRQDERLTIENTIEMTDAVVAEKDSQIAALKAQLATSGDTIRDHGDAQRNEKIRELVDADEIIAEHRQRVAQLEREIEDKLRAAELELSVERAKMARQKAELEDLRAELESKRHALNSDGPNSSPGVPRRRWLSKLGLSGDEPK
jgi:chromosome segregation ATPase